MFTSSHIVTEGESLEDFNVLHDLLIEEHRPQTPTETILVQSMAQHHWFSQRAVRLQNANIENEKKFALYMRYQSVNDRAFSKCLTDLLKLRAERRKEQIGFESQNQKRALNESKIRALNAKSEATELDSEIRQTIEAPLPGNMRIPFDTMKKLFAAAIHEVSKSA
jgi:hypothetical protein